MMRSVIVLAGCLIVAISAPLQTTVSSHGIYSVNYNTQWQELYTGQQYTFPLDELHFEFGSQVYERKDPIEDGILDDFEGNLVRDTDVYTVSDHCRLEPSSITFDRVAESDSFEDGIDAYLFDRQYGVYILADRQIVFYIVGTVSTVDQDINMFKYAHYNMTTQILNSDNAEFVHLAGNIYLTDGNKMYKMSIDTSKSDEYALLQLMPVDGYESFKSFETFIRIVQLNNTHFVVLGSSKVVIYTMSDSTTVKKLTYPIPKDLQNAWSEIVDAASDKDNLYLLDSTKGLFVLPLKAFNTYQQFDLPYGRSIKMQLTNRTIQVICEYHRNIFVAEIVTRNGKYILNRFYNQIPDFKDIDFHGQKGLFIGQHEILVLAHSVNRNALLPLSQQYMKTYPSYGINAFEVMVPYSSSNTTVLIGVSREQAIVVRMKQSAPLLKCNFNGIGSGTKTFIIEIETTFCGAFTYQSWQEKFKQDVTCRIRYPLVFKFSTPYQTKSRNMISISSVALWLAVVLFLLGAAAKWGARMNGLLRTLTQEIRKRRTSNQSRGALGSTVDMLRNPI